MQSLPHDSVARKEPGWYPEGGAEAIDAMHVLVSKQIEMCCIDWEGWDDDYPEDQF